MSKTPKLFSINDVAIVKHRSEENPYGIQYDNWEHYKEAICNKAHIIIAYKEEDKNRIIIRRPSHWSVYPLFLHKITDNVLDITQICNIVGAEHYFCGSNNENYVLDYEKGNLFYEENEHGKIIFFNKDYYKFIPHKKHNYNPKTGMVSIDYFEFINKGIPHEQDAFVKAMFSFKGENVYANIFNEIALYRKSSKSKFQTENINNLIEIIL